MDNSSASGDKLSIGGTKGHVEEVIEGDLLLLWKCCDWKPIPKCTGRYTCRERRKNDGSNNFLKTKEGADHNDIDGDSWILPSSMDPLELIQSAVALSQKNKEMGMGEQGQNVVTNDTIIKPYWEIQKFDPPPGRSDCVWVLPLDEEKRVGIISYVKEELIKKDCDHTIQRRFVHTLNSPSGFRRKLEVVGLELS